MSLSKNSTLQEMFDFVRNEDEDVQVMPITLSKENDDPARLLILIQGKPNTSHHIMANLMTAVQDMWDLAEQKNNDARKSEIVGIDGGALESDGPNLKSVS